MDSESDDYEATNSEQEYNEEEREILEDLRKERKKRAENQRLKQKREVLDFSDSEDDEDDGVNDVAELMRDSDIEGGEDDEGDLPDTMNWGKDKRNYYNTDFVDPDYSSYNAQEEDMAKAEEEEAKKIQLRLAKQLNEADFMLDDIELSTETKKTQTKAIESIKVTTDLSGLSERERVQLLQKDSPEFFGLTQDFDQHLSDIQQLTVPVLNYVRNHEVPMVPALQFANLYQNVLLSHSTNVSFYLLLKAKRSNIKYHPVVKRLVQLKQLRDQLAPRFEEYIRPQLEALLERIQDGDAFTVLDVAQRKAKLQILNKYNGKEAENNDNDDDQDISDDDNVEHEENGDTNDVDADQDEETVRRGITYQMAKNKGLTPHRKKELRNPRVKHRGKYRKALIRRKGAIRTVRKETKRYGGEVSGIKATVTKSVKFRT